MSWITKVQASRDALAAAVSFGGANGSLYMEDFLFALKATDTFHPFDSDYALEEERMGALEDMFYEMECLVVNHYMNIWNHHPGYAKPESVSVDVDRALERYCEIREAQESACL